MTDAPLRAPVMRSHVNCEPAQHVTHSKWAALCLILTFVTAGATHAQDRVSDPGGEFEETVDSAPVDSAVDEITVTGTASSVTDVQDEAQAVTAFGMADLDRASITNVDGLAFNVPGLHVGQQGSQVIVTLRGIGTENASVTGEPGVAYHVDGVNYARPTAAQVAFFDLEGVEVKRGPQGLRGGKNTTAGAINVITRKPHSDYELTADFQLGTLNERRVRAALNLPVNEYLQLRTAFFSAQRDGYQDNLFLNDDDRDAFDIDDLGVRQHIQFTPFGSLETLLSYNYFRQDGNGNQAKLIPRPAEPSLCRPGLNRFPRAVDCFQRRFTNIDLTQTPPLVEVGDTLLTADQSLLDAPDKILTDEPSKRDNRFWGFTSTTTWQAPYGERIGDSEVKLIAAFESTKTASHSDFDSTNLAISILDIADESDQYSAELQWSTSANEQLNWQLSGFFMREASKSSFVLPRLDNFQNDVGVYEDFVGDQDVTNKGYGLAVHADWTPTEAITLGLGARYTKDTRSIKVLRETTGVSSPGLALQSCKRGHLDQFNDFVPDAQDEDGNPILIGFRPGPNGSQLPIFQTEEVPSCRREFRHLTGGVNLEWRPASGQLFYARADRGYKAGGFANLGFGEYDPEFIWAYSVGAKNAFFDDRLTINTEAYFYDYKDLQIVVIDGLSIRTDNAKAEVYGVDVELSAEPVTGLQLDAKFGYIKTDLTEYDAIDPTDSDKTLARLKSELDPKTFPDPPALDDYSGNELARAPSWTVTLGAQYDFYLGRWGMLTPRIQYYQQDETYFRAFNTPLDLQDGYHRTDVKLTWASPDEAWTVEGFVNNLEDELVFQNLLVGPNVVGSPLNAWYGAPRIWGIRLGFRY